MNANLAFHHIKADIENVIYIGKKSLRENQIEKYDKDRVLIYISAIIYLQKCNV